MGRSLQCFACSEITRRDIGPRPTKISLVYAFHDSVAEKQSYLRHLFCNFESLVNRSIILPGPAGVVPPSVNQTVLDILSAYQTYHKMIRKLFMLALCWHLAISITTDRNSGDPLMPFQGTEESKATVSSRFDKDELTEALTELFQKVDRLSTDSRTTWVGKDPEAYWHVESDILDRIEFGKVVVVHHMSVALPGAEILISVGPETKRASSLYLISSNPERGMLNRVTDLLNPLDQHKAHSYWMTWRLFVKENEMYMESPKKERFYIVRSAFTLNKFLISTGQFQRGEWKVKDLRGEKYGQVASGRIDVFFTRADRQRPLKVRCNRCVKSNAAFSALSSVLAVCRGQIDLFYRPTNSWRSWFKKTLSFWGASTKNEYQTLQRFSKAVSGLQFTDSTQLRELSKELKSDGTAIVKRIYFNNEMKTGILYAGSQRGKTYTTPFKWVKGSVPNVLKITPFVDAHGAELTRKKEGNFDIFRIEYTGRSLVKFVSPVMLEAKDY